MDCTLYLADNCNLECTYCYEGHQKGMDRISKTTVEKAIDFLEQINTDSHISPIPQSSAFLPVPFP